jgi:radical SAM superfamily enzyme
LQQPGIVYEHCRIELPEFGTVDTAIEVKNIFETTDRQGRVKRRAGCVFVKLDGKTEMQLQRFVAKMQQQIAAEKAER